MDDTDAARSTEAFAQGIRADLDWLGMTPDDEVKQSDRFARYEEMFGRLVASGRIYPCYESAQELELKRKVLLSRGLPPVYDRAGLKLPDEARDRLGAERSRPPWPFRPAQATMVRWKRLVRRAAQD